MASWGKARLTGRQTAPGSSPAAATAQGQGLFKIPVDGGAPVRIVVDEAFNPVCSPNGDLIVYASGFGGAGGRSVLRGVRPDGTPSQCRKSGPCGWSPPFPAERSGPGLPAATLNPKISGCSISLRTQTRQLTHFSDRGFLNTFDVTPDGKYLVFDRTRQNSDIVRIDLPAR